MKAMSFSLFRGVPMTNKLLLLLIALSFIGIIMACLATVPSYGSVAHVEIPSDEIEIEFIPSNEPQNVSCNEYTCSYTVDK